MKRLIYLNKPMNIIVVITRGYTKKVETSLDETSRTPHPAPPPPPPHKKRFARDVKKQEECSKTYVT